MIQHRADSIDSPASVTTVRATDRPAALTFGRYAAYMLFAPSLRMGPILRYGQFSAELDAARTQRNGGALLTGGYGSVIGAALGALIFGVVQQGLYFAGVESSLFRVFLGVILLIAVVFNSYIRRMITGEK